MSVLLVAFVAFGLAGAKVLAQDAPKADAPKVEAPAAEAPAAEAPKAEAPAAEAPKAEAPAAEAPKAEAPAAEAPKAEAPAAEAPKAEAPAAEAKIVELTGKVAVVKDAEGLLKSASLSVGEGDKAETVAVALDFNGRRMARTAADKVVTVSGIVAEADGKKTVTVQKFTVVEKPAEAAK
jgi:hypothetical protein